MPVINLIANGAKLSVIPATTAEIAVTLTTDDGVTIDLTDATFAATINKIGTEQTSQVLAEASGDGVLITIDAPTTAEYGNIHDTTEMLCRLVVTLGADTAETTLTAGDVIARDYTFTIAKSLP